VKLFCNVQKHLVKGREAQFLLGRRCRSGVVAVEFALLLLPFTIVLLAIIETGYVALTRTVIDGAVASASRQVRTGIVQQSADPLDTFRTTLCQEVSLIVNCNLVVLDVTSFQNFPDPAALPPVGATDSFNAGTSDEITLVRVTYRWNYLTPFLQSLTLPGGNEYVASAIFKVEPFLGN
jgi:Flp pilus assembly protein TadG